jgi:NTP pyrophosphatase (non-canonical NTP hydrolase)
MNKELLSFIRTLSDNDTKTLTQKALKTTEEVGELAKAVLPFENAAGTLHRFIQKKQILENSIDVILCALSIAQSLGYSDQEIEDMMAEKAKKWSGLQAKEVKGKFPLPFEIHVTVEMPKPWFPIDNESAKNFLGHTIDKFKEVCGEIKVKPIILDLERGYDVVMVDMMTASVHYGDNTSAQKEVDRITSELKDKGYNVLRAKIETVPWHPAAPSAFDQDYEAPEHTYFESHLRVITTRDRREELLDIAKRRNAHLSRNWFKKMKDDQYIIMMTLREYDEVREGFELLVSNLKEDLELEDFVVDKAEIEFALYDTNNDHDSKWIGKNEDEE